MNPYKEEKSKFGVSMPPEIVAQIDAQVRQWHTNRSQALVRVWQEWKQLQVRPCPLEVSEAHEKKAVEQTGKDSVQVEG